MAQLGRMGLSRWRWLRSEAPDRGDCEGRQVATRLATVCVCRPCAAFGTTYPPGMIAQAPGTDLVSDGYRVSPWRCP
ncbi:MAG: hypothetical protein AAGG54_17170, partial [Pseudomonadota bacterium]